MVLPQIEIDLMGAYTALRPLALFIGGIVVYGVFVFHFYRFLARKDIFELNLSKHDQSRHSSLRKTFAVVFYLFRSLLLFPMFVFFWFLVMAGLLFVMGRHQSIDSVLLAAMGVVAAIRVCSYYNSALSTDIAKILPFALLGIMLIDNSLIRIPDSTAGIQEAAQRWETMIYYLGGVVALEFVLRTASGIFGLLRRSAAGPESARESTDSKGDPPERGRPDVATPDVPTHDRRSEGGPGRLPAGEPIPDTNAPSPEFLEVLERVAQRRSSSRSADAPTRVPPGSS